MERAKVAFDQEQCSHRPNTSLASPFQPPQPPRAPSLTPPRHSPSRRLKLHALRRPKLPLINVPPRRRQYPAIFIMLLLPDGVHGSAAPRGPPEAVQVLLPVLAAAAGTLAAAAAGDA